MKLHSRMEFNLSLIFIIILFLSGYFVTEIQCSNVVEIYSGNVDKIVDGSKFVFVFFYAPWDGQSRKVLDIYDKVGEEFASRDDVVVAKANAYEDVKLATRYWIDRYPLFRFFVKGSKVEETYRGGRKADDFINFIRSRSFVTSNKEIFTRPVIELDDSNFERVVKDRTKNIMVLYYNGFCKLCRQMEYSYHQVGLTFRNEPDCVLARMDCDAYVPVCLEQLVAHYPTIKIYTKTNKDGIIYEPGKNQEFYSEANMTSFMNALCSTQRTSKGRLNEKAGRLEEFDELTVQFMKDWSRREHILRKVKHKSSTHDSKEYASYYASVMGRVIKEGGHVIGHEIERIERLIVGQVHPKKMDELEKRKNILKQFHALHHEKDEL